MMIFQLLHNIYSLIRLVNIFVNTAFHLKNQPVISGGVKLKEQRQAAYQYINNGLIMGVERGGIDNGAGKVYSLPVLLY